MSNNFFTTHGINNMKIHHKHLATAACLVAFASTQTCYGMEKRDLKLNIVSNSWNEKEFEVMQKKMNGLDLWSPASPFFSNYRRMKNNVEGEDLATLQKRFLERTRYFEEEANLSLKQAEDKYCRQVPTTGWDTLLDTEFTNADGSYKDQIRWEQRILNPDMCDEKLALLELYEASKDHLRTIGAGQVDENDPVRIRYVEALKKLPHLNATNTDTPNTCIYWWGHKDELSDFFTYLSSEKLKRAVAYDKELIDLFMRGKFVSASIFYTYSVYESLKTMDKQTRDDFVESKFRDNHFWSFQMANAILGTQYPFMDVNQHQIDIFSGSLDVKNEIHRKQLAELTEKFETIEKLLAHKGCTVQELHGRMEIHPSWLYTAN